MDIYLNDVAMLDFRTYDEGISVSPIMPASKDLARRFLWVSPIK
jgi:hypothetical protein